MKIINALVAISIGGFTYFLIDVHPKSINPIAFSTGLLVFTLLVGFHKLSDLIDDKK